MRKDLWREKKDKTAEFWITLRRFPSLCVIRKSIVKITKAVIPVAGKGTRFLPATKEIPKEMLPLVDRPMIHYVVDEALQAGIEEIVFVTAAGKSSIEDYFDRNVGLEAFLQSKGKEDSFGMIRDIGKMADIITVRQGEALGLGHAISCAEKILGKEDFAVLLGDEIILGEEPVTRQLMRIYRENGNSGVVGVMEIDRGDTDKYGVIEGEPLEEGSATFKLNRMVEKPSPREAPSNLATPGRYILTGEIFSILKSLSPGTGGEIQLTDGINSLASRTSVYAHKFVGDRYDTGNIPSYLNALLELSLASEKYSGIMKTLIKEKVSKYSL